MQDEKENDTNKDTGQYFPHLENLWIEKKYLSIPFSY